MNSTKLGLDGVAPFVADPTPIIYNIFVGSVQGSDCFFSTLSRTTDQRNMGQKWPQIRINSVIVGLVAFKMGTN